MKDTLCKLTDDYSPECAMCSKKNDCNRTILYKTLISFTPILLLISLGTLLFFNIKENIQIALYKDKEQVTLNLQLDNINEDINNVIVDLKILASENEFHQLLNDTENTALLEKMNEKYRNISWHKRSYDQIRYLNENGMEVVRVNFNQGNPRVVTKSKLQNKKNRYYFAESFILNEGSIFVSPFDLNMERGQIETPLKPMLRFATPVFDESKKKRGIVMINYLGNHVLKHIVGPKGIKVENEMYLLNADGYWLKGIRPEHEWAFMYEDKKDITFHKFYPQAWDSITAYQASQFINAKGLFTFKTVFPLLTQMPTNSNSRTEIRTSVDAKNYYWKIISFVPANKLFKKRNTQRTQVSIILAIILLGGGIIIWQRTKALYLKNKAQLSIRASEERYRSVVDNARELIWEENKYGKLLFVNKYAETVFGIKNEQLISNYLNSFIAVDQIDRKRIIDKKLRLGELTQYETQIKNSHNNLIDLEVRAIALNKQKAGLIILNFGRDVTQRKKAAKILKENEQSLRELNATKDKFFSIIAHDLKNPFNSMLGLSAILLKKFEVFENSKKIKYISLINQSLKNTYRLTENLLTWANSQRGAVSIKPEKVNLSELVTETVLLIELSAKNKNIKIENKVLISSTVMADKNMLQTVIRNLISNAIKFTPSGGNIAITTDIVESKKPMTQVSITDNGLGISAIELTKLFDIDVNSSSPGTENEKGTGLGLILCKEFIQKQGGTIWAESKVGRGSVFKFTIPVA